MPPASCNLADLFVKPGTGKPLHHADQMSDTFDGDAAPSPSSAIPADRPASAAITGSDYAAFPPPSSLLDRILFRAVQPMDIPRCRELENASYPPGEAASKSRLQYWQHHAAPYFRCAFLIDDASSPGRDPPGQGVTPSNLSSSGVTADLTDAAGTGSMRLQTTLRGTVIGYICSTRCKEFAADSMATHDAAGKLLAVHTVVVEERYRRQGVGGAMLRDYVGAMRRMNAKVEEARGLSSSIKVGKKKDQGRGGLSSSIKVGKKKDEGRGGPSSAKGGKKKNSKMDKVVLLAKKDLLAFYVVNGFRVTRVSPIVHGRDRWFELERDDIGGGVGVGGQQARKESSGGGKRKECFVVDAFADPTKPGSGNPAAVVIFSAPPTGISREGGQEEDDDETSLDSVCRKRSGSMSEGFVGSVKWMKVVAREFNLAETAFVWPIAPVAGGATSGGGNNYGIRFYSRTGAEVDLCGHATLASASVLLKKDKESSGGGDGGKGDEAGARRAVTFRARRDVLQAELTGATPSPGGSSSSSSAVRISMDFPRRGVSAVPAGEEGAVLAMFYRAFFGGSSLSDPPSKSEGLFSKLLRAGANVYGGGMGDGASARPGGDDTASSHSSDGSAGAAAAAPTLSLLSSLQQQQHRLFSQHILTMGTTDGNEDLFLELTEEGFDLLGRMEAVDYGALKTGWDGYSRGVIVCCCSRTAGNKNKGKGEDLNNAAADDEESSSDREKKGRTTDVVDFRSRFFGPKVGIDEDPVTGSAHCSLGPFFGAKLKKSVLVGRQESPHRGGVVECVLKGDEPRRMSIIGTAVATVSGKLLIGT